VIVRPPAGYTGGIRAAQIELPVLTVCGRIPPASISGIRVDPVSKHSKYRRSLNRDRTLNVHCLRLARIDGLHVGVPGHEPGRKFLLRNLLGLHLPLLIVV
jgi:hypothetical protein